jgi:predicted enzyme related to lactoylglutathione lyase
MQRPVHFDIYTSDPQRAINFYQQVFGWKFTEYMPGFYWLIKTGEEGTRGIDGGLGVREGAAPVKGSPANAFVCTISVPNVDETIAAVQRAGCEITQAKHVIPHVGWLFYFLDSEGNTVGAIQEDTRAA